MGILKSGSKTDSPSPLSSLTLSLPPSLPPSFPLSLSLSHTHARTRAPSSSTSTTCLPPALSVTAFNLETSVVHLAFILFLPMHY